MNVKTLHRNFLELLICFLFFTHISPALSPVSQIDRLTNLPTPSYEDFSDHFPQNSNHTQRKASLSVAFADSVLSQMTEYNFASQEQNIPKQHLSSSLERIDNLDEFITTHLPGAKFWKALGRTLLFKNQSNHVLALKLRKRDEELATLQQESQWQQQLHPYSELIPIHPVSRGDYCLFSTPINQLPMEWKHQLDLQCANVNNAYSIFKEDQSYHFIAYTLTQDNAPLAFVYIDNIEDDQEFELALERNVEMIACLKKNGLTQELVPLFHNTSSQQPFLWALQLFLFPYYRIEANTLYHPLLTAVFPNMRQLGLMDYGDIKDIDTAITQRNLGLKFYHLNDYKGNHSAALIESLGNDVLSLYLVILRRMLKRWPDYTDEEKKNKQKVAAQNLEAAWVSLYAHFLEVDQTTIYSLLSFINIPQTCTKLIEEACQFLFGNYTNNEVKHNQEIGWDQLILLDSAGEPTGTYPLGWASGLRSLSHKQIEDFLGIPIASIQQPEHHLDGTTIVARPNLHQSNIGHFIEDINQRLMLLRDVRRTDQPNFIDLFVSASFMINAVIAAAKTETDKHSLDLIIKKALLILHQAILQENFRAYKSQSYLEKDAQLFMSLLALSDHSSEGKTLLAANIFNHLNLLRMKDKESFSKFIQLLYFYHFPLSDYLADYSHQAHYSKNIKEKFWLLMDETITKLHKTISEEEYDLLKSTISSQLRKTHTLGQAEHNHSA